MNKSLGALIAIGIVLVLGTIAIILFFPRGSKGGTFDAFAQCLAEKKITIYGAYWCPHCQDQKAELGDSFKFVNYVECTKETQKCLAADIKGYPTWIFPASPREGSGGKRFEGKQGLEKLSAESSCPLPPKR